MGVQRMSQKNVKKIARKTGLDVVEVICGGSKNQEHVKELVLKDGSTVDMDRNGNIINKLGEQDENIINIT